MRLLKLGIGKKERFCVNVETTDVSIEDLINSAAALAPAVRAMFLPVSCARRAEAASNFYDWRMPCQVPGVNDAASPVYGTRSGAP
jgi:hypothetical protein